MKAKTRAAPNSTLQNRGAVLLDGPQVERQTRPPRIQIRGAWFPHKIVSGGQTGADHAALDWAIARIIEHGGWCPKSRLATDGTLAPQYQLCETKSRGYLQRTKLNVQGSDATLIFNSGALDGGTRKTVRFAELLEKPYHVFQLEQAQPEDVALEVVEWLKQGKYSVLNIAGPREEKRPGIYALVLLVLDLCVAGPAGT